MTKCAFGYSLKYHMLWTFRPVFSCSHFVMQFQWSLDYCCLSCTCLTSNRTDRQLFFPGCWRVSIFLSRDEPIRVLLGEGCSWMYNCNPSQSKIFKTGTVKIFCILQISCCIVCDWNDVVRASILSAITHNFSLDPTHGRLQ